MKTFAALILGTAVAFASPALAEGEHSHSHSHDAKRGGKVVESGHHHVEVVTKDGAIEIYVEGEDGKPEDVNEAKAKATILSEGKKEDVILSPDSANALKGTGAFKAVKGTTIVVTLTMPGHKPEQIRVVLD
ncbi:MAG: hypothetical protein B7Y80_17965 [Hyphomicrobium sp. 32-62-53]|nr:MAG: hypothetical protein B7Z29_17720 [Hyphomicrobium sp. 12-62-95]OYX97914.1 MAG: hypothetical protein B7Y80_17965 [Hyphomicrobium sp. 32-62-53]